MPSDPPTGSHARRGRRAGERRLDVRGLLGSDSSLANALRPRPTRGRRVRRTIRHIEPWSVLKISLLFHAALFLVICVASALLWSGARASGTVDNLESFITSVGGFGNCEPVDGAAPVTTSTVPTTSSSVDEVDQLNPENTSSSLTEDEEAVVAPDDDTTIDGDEDCRAGERLVGAFQFEDGRIFVGFLAGGIVLVLAGSGAAVVLTLLFNLMSDLVGGVEVTVIEEEQRRPPPDPEDRVPDGGGSGRSSSLRFPRRD
ncbi:MAG: DUF3566 domain-containing protein [Actinomycetota bacterium]|nr:DUF3566 domain-containing protein [Actinomycetota bacterium]